MPASTVKLKKFKNRGVPELRERGRQDILKVTERLLRNPSRETSQAGFTRAIEPTVDNAALAVPLGTIADRLRSASAAAVVLAPQPDRANKLLPVPAERHELVRIAKKRFPAESEAIVARAERAIELQFDLLGHRGLSFGDPIDWRFEPIAGKRTGLERLGSINYSDPAIAGDQKVTLELNRHGHFVTLGQAFWLTGDERFARAFVEQANSWMDSNPPRRGINWSSSLECSHRTIAWLWALHLMIESESVTPKFVTRLLKFLVAHGRHISAYLSRSFGPNTQLTGEALGLLYLGTALPELSHARRWRLKGLSILFDQCARHFAPDGVHFEQTTCYHRHAVDSYIHLLLLARASRLVLPDEIEMRLASALDYLMWITRPDGTSPLIGDDDGGRLLQLGVRGSTDFRDTLAAGAVLFSREDWKAVAGKAPVETLWLLGSSALDKFDELIASAPTEYSKAFNDAGVFIMRDNWGANASYALVDCGPHGASAAGFSHAHSDALSLEFAALGKNWLIDPGTFTYTGDASLRDWFRSTEAHNTVVVDGQPQSVPTGRFGWESIAQQTAHEFFDDGGVCYFEGSHDGYARLNDPVTHVRSVLFVRSEGDSSLSPYAVVRDAVDAAGHHRYSARFQFAAECMTTKCRNTITASAGSGEKLAVFCWTEADHLVRVTSGWTSSAYGERSAAPAIAVECEGSSPQQIVTLLLPQSKSAGLASVSHARGVYSISTADSFDLVACPHGPEARSALLSARCQLAWARFIGGRLSTGCVIKGSRLSIVGGLSLKSPAPIPWLTYALTGDHLRIRTRGAAHIEITTSQMVRSITLNETTFDVGAGSRRAILTLGDAGWRLQAES